MGSRASWKSLLNDNSGLQRVVELILTPATIPCKELNRTSSRERHAGQNDFEQKLKLLNYFREKGTLN